MAVQSRTLPQRTMASLIEASTAINASLDPQATLHAIARSAATVMNAEASSVLLLDRRRNKLIFTASVGGGGDSLLGEEFDADLGIAGQIASAGQPILVTDVREHKKWFKGIDDRSKFDTRSMVAAPLVHQDEIIGVVEVLNPIGGEKFTEYDVELIQIFANLAASGAVNSQRYEQLKRENRGLREAFQARDEIVGQSEALRAVQDLCYRVAKSNATVLLLGETGTGKELMAKAIHNASPRAEKPCVAINCAALPETLLESELFGHEAGAFTGAVARKLGRFELADGGTLFLDEIGDLSPAIQIKLLRVLQEREFVRVGGTKTVACNVRIIAATNRDLQAAMKEGTFREDLYYRLNVFPITLPPLRQRREDIPLLVEHFTQKASVELNMPKPTVSDAAMASMASYRWPGNIRELQNVIERAVLMADGKPLDRTHLPRELVGESVEAVVAEGDSSLWGYEKAMIVKVLQENNWNQSKAARALGISRDNLRYRIKKFKIQRPR
ncbi:MAG: sigma 54-interacting transcriptional regulator [Phycisphaerae bacterium]|nr:sigma 54-interacting transcriptional regulator [Phycisphaerae bacterium]